MTVCIYIWQGKRSFVYDTIAEAAEAAVTSNLLHEQIKQAA